MTIRDIYKRLPVTLGYVPGMESKTELKRAVTPDRLHDRDVVREVALNVARILETLAPEDRATVIQELKSGTFDLSGGKLDHLPPDELKKFSRDVGAMMAIMTDEHRDQFVHALSGFDYDGALSAIEISRREMERRNTAEREVTLAERDYVEKQIIVLDEIGAMTKAPVLQRLGETCYHKLVEANVNNALIILDGDVKPGVAEGTIAISSNANVFVMQHDWAAAFAKAQDFDGGELNFPYDEMVFEFRISGHRVCLVILADGKYGHATALLNVETSIGWALISARVFQAGEWRCLTVHDCGVGIFTFCFAQVRAMLIALEAEVAVSEVVRAPYKLNAKRERHGKLPIFDHHIVNLARRKQYEPRALEPGDQDGDHAERRLHFVRGHWRHYPSHKSWIKWHLRGNPDLGFIDKEYRL